MDITQILKVELLKYVFYRIYMVLVYIYNVGFSSGTLRERKASTQPTVFYIKNWL